MPFWDEVVEDVAADYPDVEVERVPHRRALRAVVQRPASIDVIVASNLFGDILSDLTAAIAGSIGIAPAANINPEREYPSMFEPVHGSAPDIAGKGIANPVGQTWTGALMLDHLGHGEAARAGRGRDRDRARRPRQPHRRPRREREHRDRHGER